MKARDIEAAIEGKTPLHFNPYRGWHEKVVPLKCLYPGTWLVAFGEEGRTISASSTSLKRTWEEYEAKKKEKEAASHVRQAERDEARAIIQHAGRAGAVGAIELVSQRDEALARAEKAEAERDVAKAFHDVAVQQRDRNQTERDALEAEIWRIRDVIDQYGDPYIPELWAESTHRPGGAHRGEGEADND